MTMIIALASHIAFHLKIIFIIYVYLIATDHQCKNK